jgi:hypothetical protein
MRRSLQVIEEHLAEFAQFVALCPGLLVNELPASTLVGFLEFAQEAERLEQEVIRDALPELRRRLCTLAPWLVSCDLLHEARITDDEDRYTRLLAWALDAQVQGDSVAQAM